MAIATTASWVSHGQWPWIRSQGWDLTFIILSSALVSVPLALYYWFGVSADAINLIVAGLVGGPHMYSTYTLTFWERTFWRRYPLYTAAALLIPVAVVYLAITDLALLLFVFLAWASVHVLHQVAYLADCYRARGGESLAGLSRTLDYVAIFVSLYPVAIYKLSNDTFGIENQPIYRYFPSFLKADWFVYAVWAVFAVAVGLWLAKTAREYWERRLNYPKTLLIAVTIVLSAIIPTFDNLDVAFQGMNTWHSFQYLALLWYVNQLRQDRGEISSGVVRGLAGKGMARRFYGFHVGLTLMAGTAIMALYWASSLFGWGLRLEQCYFMVVLGTLLMHYYFDTLLFTRVGAVVPALQGALPGVRGL